MTKEYTTILIHLLLPKCPFCAHLSLQYGRPCICDPPMTEYIGLYQRSLIFGHQYRVPHKLPIVGLNFFAIRYRKNFPCLSRLFKISIKIGTFWGMELHLNKIKIIKSDFWSSKGTIFAKMKKNVLQKFNLSMGQDYLNFLYYQLRLWYLVYGPIIWWPDIWLWSIVKDLYSVIHCPVLLFHWGFSSRSGSSSTPMYNGVKDVEQVLRISWKNWE